MPDAPDTLLWIHHIVDNFIALSFFFFFFSSFDMAVITTSFVFSLDLCHIAHKILPVLNQEGWRCEEIWKKVQVV